MLNCVEIDRNRNMCRKYKTTSIKMSEELYLKCVAYKSFGNIKYNNINNLNTERKQTTILMNSIHDIN